MALKPPGILAATTLLIGLLCGPARAQASRTDSTDLAGQKFSEANTAFNEERYSVAARLFEEAYRLAPRPGILFNAAAAWDLADEDARAATRYQEALQLTSLDPESRQQATIRLNALKPRLANVEINKPAGALVTVDHMQRAPVPVRFFLRPGRYVLDAEYKGGVFQRRASFLEGQSRTVALNLPEPEPAPPPLTNGPDVAPTESNATRTAAWVSLATGVALSGTAIFLGTRFLAAKADYDDENPQTRSSYERADSLRTWTNVAWGGAALTGGVGLALLLASPTFEF